MLRRFISKNITIRTFSDESSKKTKIKQYQKLNQRINPPNFNNSYMINVNWMREKIKQVSDYDIIDSSKFVDVMNETKEDSDSYYHK